MYMTNTIEIWKDLENYEGIYKISNHGKIKNTRGNLVKGWITNVNYIKVRLYKNKKSKDFYMHRLVAYNFLPPKEGKNVINHLDSNPRNNKVSNLQWCTQAENMRHAKINNRMNTDGRKILHIESGKIYKSIKEASDDFDIKQNTLVYQLRRSSKKCQFRYV
jgi:hypothetical protein